MQLTGKALRQVDRSLVRMYDASGIVPVDFTSPGSQSPTFLSRMIRLPYGGLLQFTDIGYQHFISVVKQIHSLQVFGDNAAYRDVWNATKSVIEASLSKGDAPVAGNAFVQLVREQVEPNISLRSFAASVYGIELDKNRPISLSGFSIVPATTHDLEASGLPIEQEHLSRHLKDLGPDPFIIGTTCGTKFAAETKFQTKANLLVGLLAVFAGANYANGPTGFRLGIRLSAESNYGRATYFSWTARKEEATVHLAFPKSQILKLNSFEERLHVGGYFDTITRAIDATARTKLEEALVRALYWFCDAQRDTVTVMQFIKYWSCIETFFSTPESVVRSVSTGLATALVAGGGSFFKADEYGTLKRRITRLYTLRCRALHGASYSHVTAQDVADLSQWTAWLLLVVAELVDSGYTTTEEVRVQTHRIDKTLSGAHTNAMRQASD